MTVQQLNLVAPSGGRVRVSLPGDAPVASVAAGVRFAGGSYGTGFQIGSRGYHDFACTRVAPATTRDRFPVHGREVVVSEANDHQSSVATLIGTYHELMTVYAGPAPRRERISALFGSLHIVDEVAGMTVRPHSATLLDTMTEHLVVVVRDRGTVVVPGPRQAHALAPRHAGAPTRYGEVWRAPYPGAEDSARAVDHSFILGCPAGLAEVHLTGGGAGTAGSRDTDAGASADAADEAKLLAWLNEIDIAWYEAG